MTLGELIRLYKAEQDGKQVIMYESSSDHGYYEVKYKVKLADMELSDFIRKKEGVYVTFYIEGEREY